MGRVARSTPRPIGPSPYPSPLSTRERGPEGARRMEVSPATAPPRLRMAGVHKRFGATAALSGVDLEVLPGQVVALVGENGAGKSTLMKVLSGAHPADAGEMWLDGSPYQPRTPMDARRSGVAMIY